jgi:hypothetical protein
MARFSIYVSEEELGWIKEQKPGKVRDLVKQAMTSPVPSVSSSVPESVSPSVARLPPGVQRGVAGIQRPECKECTAPLVSGKCPFGHKQ